MKNGHQKKKVKAKDIARERIKELFKQADSMFKKNPKLSNRYVSLALRLSTRIKVRIPLELKRSFCKHCKSYLRVGTNARIRLNKGKKTYFCMNCKTFTRVPYK